MADALPLPPGFDSLTTEEKIEYVQSLWDHIASDLDSVPLTEWQKQLLDERLKDLEENPSAGVSWEEVRATILKNLGNRGA